MMTQPQPRAEALDMDKFFEDGLACNLDIRWWRGQRKLRAGDLGLKDEDVPELFSLGRKLLIPRETSKRLHNLENQAFRAVEHYSFKFPFGGRFVPIAALGELLERIEGIEQDFIQARDELLDNYEEVQRQMLDRFPRYRHVLVGFYPGIEEVREKYSFELSLYEVRFPRDMQVNVVNIRKARQKAKAESVKEKAQMQAASEAAVKYRERFERQVSDWTEEVAGTIRAETVRVVEQLSTAIAKGEVHPRQVDSLNLWVDRFRALNFLDDRQMELALRELQRLTAGGAKTLNNSNALASIRQAVDSCLKEATKPQGARSIALRYQRSIQME